MYMCFEILSGLNAAVQASHLPNTQAVICCLSGCNTTLAQQWVSYAKQCVEPGLQYFKTKFTEALSVSVAAFKAAGLLLPFKIDEMQSDASEVDTLQVFLFLSFFLSSGG